MPNSRKDGKKNKTVWLTEDERNLLASIRKALGCKTDTEAIKRALQDLAKTKGIK